MCCWFFVIPTENRVNLKQIIEYHNPATRRKGCIRFLRNDNTYIFFYINLFDIISYNIVYVFLTIPLIYYFSIIIKYFLVFFFFVFYTSRYYTLSYLYLYVYMYMLGAFIYGWGEEDAGGLGTILIYS